MVRDRGKNGKLMIHFDKLSYFGSTTRTKLIFMKFKESGSEFELLTDIIDLIIRKFVESNLIKRNELINIRQTK